MTLLKTKSSYLPSLMDSLFNNDWDFNIPNLQSSLPAVNILEKKDHFELVFAVPGKEKKDFEVEIENDVLTVSSKTEKTSEEEDEKTNFTHREFHYDSFSRSFTLPETVNSENIAADYKNGVLTITLPKLEEALPKPKKQIVIK